MSAVVGTRPQNPTLLALYRDLTAQRPWGRFATLLEESHRTTNRIEQCFLSCIWRMQQQYHLVLLRRPLNLDRIAEFERLMRAKEEKDFSSIYTIVEKQLFPKKEQPDPISNQLVSGSKEEEDPTADPTLDEIRAWVRNPENQPTLAQLQYLNLSKRGITTLPSELYLFPGLKVIELKGNGICVFPFKILVNFPALEAVVLEENFLKGNDLTAIPQSFIERGGIISLFGNPCMKEPQAALNLLALFPDFYTLVTHTGGSKEDLKNRPDTFKDKDGLWKSLVAKITTKELTLLLDLRY